MTLKFIGFSVLLLFFSISGFAQNTKGDRPVKNQRQVREIKGKSVRKKSKATTRDIANRRLRTKDKSSANRANAQYVQRSPYINRSKATERAARPRGRVFSRSPRESRTQAWKGDVSGYRLKQIKPGNSDAARTNVYPQKGPYVNHLQNRLKEKRPVYGRTIKGRKVGNVKPQHQERAWTGGRDKAPIKNQSASGSVRNVYPNNKGPYATYAKKRLAKRETPVSNRSELGFVKRFSRKPLTGGAGLYGNPASASRPFIKSGKKNVYWGKFSKKERPFLRDLTGGPLRTRNFKTMPPDLVGTDTVKFFGRKPGGDRANNGGQRAPSITGNRLGWRKGDISGWRLRKSTRSPKEGVGEFIFPRRLSISSSGRQGERIPGSGFRTNTKRGEQAQINSVPGKVYRRGLNGKVTRGAKRLLGGDGSYQAARFSGNIPQRKGFSEQGANYSGNIKRSSIRGFSPDGVGYSGKIKRSSIRGFSLNGVDYSGKIKRSSIRGFSLNGVDYSGKIKRSSIRGFSPNGVDYSGKIRRSSIRGFSTNGVDYSGKINRNSIRGFSPNGVDYSGKIKRSSIRGFSTNGVDYSGKINRNNIREISPQGAGFGGNIKYKRPDKGGGSVSGRLWNNDNSAIQKRSPVSDQGGNFSGNIKFKRPEKGGGSVSAQPRNNNGKAVFVRPPVSEQGGNFSGNIKFKRPEKGGGSVSSQPRNNNFKAVFVRPPVSEQGGNFSGNIKYKRPEKGGGSVSGIIWNNENTPIQSRRPLNDDADYSGKIALSKFRKNYVQNPNAVKESVRKHRMDPSAFRVAGLGVKIREGNYKEKPNAANGSMRGVAPSRATVKAGEYARSMKQYWEYKHNPNSAGEALKVRVPGKATARIGDFQGNVKMHKYTGHGLHPDSQFAHGHEDNVKEERTLLTNVKLIWGKLFRKNETQPDNLKEKNHRPRYDKREKGLWNE